MHTLVHTAKTQRVQRKARQRGGATFRCPKCQEVSRVLRTTRPDSKKVVMRQRQCLSCDTIFTTKENLHE